MDYTDTQALVLKFTNGGVEFDLGELRLFPSHCQSGSSRLYRSLLPHVSFSSSMLSAALGRLAVIHPNPSGLLTRPNSLHSSQSHLHSHFFFSLFNLLPSPFYFSLAVLHCHSPRWRLFPASSLLISQKPLRHERSSPSWQAGRVSLSSTTVLAACCCSGLILDSPVR